MEHSKDSIIHSIEQSRLKFCPYRKCPIFALPLTARLTSEGQRTNKHEIIMTWCAVREAQSILPYNFCYSMKPMKALWLRVKASGLFRDRDVSGAGHRNTFAKLDRPIKRAEPQN